MTKWEYKIVRTTAEKMLSIGKLAVDKTDEELQGSRIDEAFNILGEQGWELTESAMAINKENIYPWFVFKRELNSI